MLRWVLLATSPVSLEALPALRFTALLLCLCCSSGCDPGSTNDTEPVATNASNTTSGTSVGTTSAASIGSTTSGSAGGGGNDGATPVERHGQLTVSLGRLSDANGEPVTLRG